MELATEIEQTIFIVNCWKIISHHFIYYFVMVYYFKTISTQREAIIYGQLYSLVIYQVPITWSITVYLDIFCRVGTPYAQCQKVGNINIILKSQEPWRNLPTKLITLSPFYAGQATFTSTPPHPTHAPPKILVCVGQGLDKTPNRTERIFLS